MPENEHSCTTGAHPEPKLGCYNHHSCRCDGCRLIIADYGRERYRAAAGFARDSFVSSLGARRRLRALATIGWSPQSVAERLGVNRSVVSAIRVGTRDRVKLSTHRRIAEVYRELCMTPRPAARFERGAQIHARKLGWESPLHWEDIDRD